MPVCVGDLGEAMLTSAVSSPSAPGNGLAESHRHEAGRCSPTDVKETRPSEVTSRVQGHTATAGAPVGL